MARGKIRGFVKGLLAGLAATVLAVALLMLVLPAPPELTEEPVAIGEPPVEGAEIGQTLDPGTEEAEPELAFSERQDDPAVIRPVELPGLGGLPAVSGAGEPAAERPEAGSSASDGATGDGATGESTTGEGATADAGAGTAGEAAAAEEGAGSGLETEAGSGDAGDALGEIAATMEPGEPEEEQPRFPPPLEGGDALALNGPALTVNAADFPAPENAPLVGVILTDVEDAVPPDVLFALPVPAALALDPASADPALVEAVRARNWEVVATLPVAQEGDEGPAGALVEGMEPDELSARTEALMARLSSAVAAGAALDDDAAREAVRSVLDRHGFAWLGGPRAPLPESLPADADGEAVTQRLDAALQQAGESGAALVVLPRSRVALQALARWNAATGEGRLAPLSAVLRRQAEG